MERLGKARMKPTMKDRLLWRELGYRPKDTTVKGFYGDGTWIENLDIVNELGGHSGCVNALRWRSTSLIWQILLLSVY